MTLNECPSRACRISVTFVTEKDGSETTVQAPIGKHLLEVAHDNDIELEGL
jgi:ferredoxin